MDIIPMIVRSYKRFNESIADGRVVTLGGEDRYFPQIVMPDGTIWRGPSVGIDLAQDQIDHQYDLLKSAVQDHGFDPQIMEWTEITI